MGMFQALCSVCMCFNADFIASDWVWFHEAMLGHWDIGPGRGDRWVCPRCGLTFVPGQVPLGVWQVKGEAMSVNEALLAGVIKGTIWPDGS